MQTGSKLLSSLPSSALRPPVFQPGSGEDAADAAEFVMQVEEAADEIAGWLDGDEGRDEPRMPELLRMFAHSVNAQAEYTAGLIAAGAGLQGRSPGPILARLATARRRLAELERRLVDLNGQSLPSALAALRAAAGIVKGAPADAVEDERALYDG